MATVFTPSCACIDNEDGSATGTTTYECTLGSDLGTLDQTCDDTPADALEDCNNECGYFGEWTDWTAYFPECIDDVDGADTLFNDLDKHLPKRFRSRACVYMGESGETVNIEKISDSFNRCTADDAIETQFKSEDYQCEDNSVFDNIDTATQVETKVVVDFTVRIYEEWQPALADANSTEFNNLAELYIMGFLSKLEEAAVSDDNVKFATVRVIAFVELHAGEFKADRRRRRRQSDSTAELSTIEAEFETVYNVLAEQDASEDLGISAEAATSIQESIKEEVATKVDEVINPRENGVDWEEGELNFLNTPVVVDVPVFERAIVADYGVDITEVCNCATSQREDFYSCVTVEKDVSQFEDIK